MQHELILGFIILGAGLLAGTTNYLFYYFKEAATKKGEIFKYLLISIGASLLVPLLLNMLSSDLIKKSDTYNSLNYFVFAGFCFVAGYYSDKFINSIGDKILKDIENTKTKVNTALNEVRKNEEKIDILVSSETEADDEGKIISEIKLEELTPSNKFNDEDMQTQLDKIVKSFNGKYKFRTFTGIAKELKYPPNIVKIILEGLEKEGATKRFNNNDGKEIWALTNIGQIMANRK